MDIKKIKQLFNNGNNKYILLIILVGASLMLVSGGGKDKKDTVEDKSINIINLDEEKRLSKILSKIDGVKDVDVMITYYSTSRADIAYDMKSSDSVRREGEDRENSERNNTKQAIMSDGEPVIVSNVYPEVKGVIICCRGAEDEITRGRILDAVTCVLGVGAHKVAIMERGGG